MQQKKIALQKERGIKDNDRIIKINNKDTSTAEEIIDAIQQTENSEILLLTIKRGNENLEISLVPDTLYSYYIGIRFKMAENNFTNNMYYAFYNTRDFVLSLGDNLKQLFTGNVGINQMIGPVGISEAVANTTGFSDFIYLMALISLSLGITNLLPFPPLDGGKFALLILEAIRGKKLNETIEINLNLLGFAILIALSIYVTYNDVLRIM